VSNVNFGEAFWTGPNNTPQKPTDEFDEWEGWGDSESEIVNDPYGETINIQDDD